MADRLDFVAHLKHLQVQRTFEEVGDLGKHLLNGDLRRGWVFLDNVQLLEVSPLEAYVVPVLLECLFVELIDALDDLVDEDGKFDF